MNINIEINKLTPTRVREIAGVMDKPNLNNSIIPAIGLRYRKGCNTAGAIS